jgi:hypothetical protein
MNINEIKGTKNTLVDNIFLDLKDIPLKLIGEKWTEKNKIARRNKSIQKSRIKDKTSISDNEI